MHRSLARCGLLLGISVGAWCPALGTLAATPTAERALSLMPVQPHVEYEKPTAEEIATCKVEVTSQPGLAGWEVFNDKNQLLRRFLDTNGDKKIDLWCYYKDGLEVYRDVDSDFNEKADQYRWLGTAGSRWGIDSDEDGRIDSWKTISPEEVTAEVVASLRHHDFERFQRVLLTENELKGLGLGDEREEEIRKRILDASEQFKEFAKGNRLVAEHARWIHFGAQRPGIIPAGTAGSSKDLLIYDNAAAIVENDGKHGQVIVGTLVHVGSGWRVIDLPSGEAGAGFFTSISGRTPSDVKAEVGIDKKMQELLTELEAIDQKFATAGANEQTALNRQRADVLEKLAAGADTLRERDTWVRQFADTVSAATQSGNFPDGVDRLKQMLKTLDRERDGEDLIAFVQFRYLSSDYAQQMQSPDADFAKVQQWWLENLESFVKRYASSPEAAEVMLQLAIAQEFAGKDSEAAQWYGRIVKDFASSPLAKKARGAKWRLESVGKPLTLKGETLDGKSLDLERLKGRVVLVHYWATWCEPCKEDLETIKRLYEKNDNRKFVPIGVNLDHDRKVAEAYLRQNRLPWPQLYEEGGLDSRLANEVGILTLPTMLLIDSKGEVARRNVHAGELDAELERMIE